MEETLLDNFVIKIPSKGNPRIHKKTCPFCGKIFMGVRKSRFCSGSCSVRYFRNKQVDEFGNLRCSICKEFLPPENFNSSKRGFHRFGKAHNCKKCDYRRQREGVRKAGENVDRYIKRLLMLVRRRNSESLKRGDLRFLNYDIDLNYIKNLYNEQGGLCAISGIKMTAFLGTHGRVGTNMSLDRFDNSLGYIKGNVQLTCSEVNILKNTLSMDRLYQLCELILKKRDCSKL